MTQKKNDTMKTNEFLYIDTHTFKIIFISWSIRIPSARVQGNRLSYYYKGFHYIDSNFKSEANNIKGLPSQSHVRIGFQLTI